MNETIDTYTDLIKLHAYVALKKVRKPSDYELDDFIQEGIKIFLMVKKDLYDPKKNCSFKTFFTRILRQHFGSMVTQSYKHTKTTYDNGIAIENKIWYKAAKLSHSALDIISMRYVIQDFTADELEYVKTILLFIDKPTKFRRKFTREALEISYERERELRNSIHDKILK